MRRHPRFDVILFDIDNVLVDTRQSYLTAIQKTVERCLNRPGIVSLREIDQFKLLGGFNDDWDCCYGILTFLQTSLQEKPIRSDTRRPTRLSIAELKERFPERPLGVRGLLKHLKALYERVETPSYRKVAKIFQKIYLGSRGKAGLIRKEKLIFPKSLLKRLRARGIRFGIVTGRNRLEAEYALKRFGIFELFDRIVTIDEVHHEEKRTGKNLRKPEPWSLLQAARHFQKGTVPLKGDRSLLKFLYVGDLPDDVLAAKRAAKWIKIASAVYSKLSSDPKTTAAELRHLKPNFILKDPKELLKIV